ncbi:MAG: hypothetical protein ACTSPB_17350 [Candidatus Thorarchaeota archaeon]
MSLADKLNSALLRNSLQPIIAEEVVKEEIPKEEKADRAFLINRTEKIESVVYETLKKGLKSANKHKPDHFGTIVIVVENIGNKIQLPRREGKYIVDDIQRMPNGHYEVHLVNDQR